MANNGKGTVFLTEILPTEAPLDLLLEADPSRVQIEGYINQSEVIAAYCRREFHGSGNVPGITESGPGPAGIIGVVVITGLESKMAEIACLAVGESFRGQGIGRRLIAAALDKALENCCESMVICTGNSSIGQLALYQKMGFRIVRIVPDYFSREYPEQIIENGIVCRDRIIMERQLKQQ